MLEIDPLTRSVSTFGSLGPSLTDVQCSGSVHCGDEKWIGGVHIPGTAKIIGIPYAAETVLEIDTEKRTTSTFGIVSSSVKRKWVDGVLGRNGLIYAIPYDADVVLEIDPETRALMLFGRVGGDPCKWYGGVLAPNGKIYTIPYSSPYVLEIDTERRIARPFAMTYPHWAKWSGGVLAPNGKIYGIPALSKSILEIDVEKEQTSLYGMLPGGNDLQDKWAGGVLAPNGKVYGMPWRSSSVLEFDPTTKAISLLGQGIGASNFSWSGGVLAKDGRIVAVPYNGAWVLEIGESVCTPDALANAAKQQMIPPLHLEHLSSQGLTGAPGVADYSRAAPVPATAQVPTAKSVAPLYDTAKPFDSAAPQQSTKGVSAGGVMPSLLVPSYVPQLQASAPGGGALTAPGAALAPGAARTFVLALLGCPDEAKATEDACFHLSHRTWHSAMVTIMRPDATLHDIREQVLASRLSHVPTNFCFLYNGHALDPNVEATIAASSVAVVTTAPDTHSSQFVVLIDNVHCIIAPNTFIASIGLPDIGSKASTSFSQLLLIAFLFGTLAGLLVLLMHGKTGKDTNGGGAFAYTYNRVPASEAQEAQSLMDAESGSDKDKSSDKMDNCDKRIPCLPHARLTLRPMFKASHAVARLSPKNNPASRECHGIPMHAL